MPKLTLEQKKWFPYDDSEPNDAKIEIRYLEPGDWDEIQAISSTVEGRPITKEGSSETEMETVIKPIPGKRAKEILKRAVVNWDGFQSHTGKELPCNKENILRFHSNLPGFFDRVSELIEIYQKEVDEAREGSDPN